MKPTETTPLDPVTLDQIEDGREFTSDGYDLWALYRDSGSWWITSPDSPAPTELGSTAKAAARSLTELGFTAH